MNFAQILVGLLALASGVDSGDFRNRAEYEAYRSLAGTYGSWRTKNQLREVLYSDLDFLNHELMTPPRWSFDKLRVARQFLASADIADGLGVKRVKSTYVQGFMNVTEGRRRADSAIAMITADLTRDCSPGSACEDDDDDYSWD